MLTILQANRSLEYRNQLYYINSLTSSNKSTSESVKHISIDNPLLQWYNRYQIL